MSRTPVNKIENPEKGNNLQDPEYKTRKLEEKKIVLRNRNNEDNKLKGTQEKIRQLRKRKYGAGDKGKEQI
ncbi:unnamed protein product [Caretta caretta]